MLSGDSNGIMRQSNITKPPLPLAGLSKAAGNMHRGLSAKAGYNQQLKNRDERGERIENGGDGTVHDDVGEGSFEGLGKGLAKLLKRQAERTQFAAIRDSMTGDVNEALPQDYVPRELPFVTPCNLPPVRTHA